MNGIREENVWQLSVKILASPRVEKVCYSAQVGILCASVFTLFYEIFIPPLSSLSYPYLGLERMAS